LDQETLRAYQDEFMAFGEYLKSIWEWLSNYSGVTKD